MDKTRIVLRLLFLAVSTLHVLCAQTPAVPPAAAAGSTPAPDSISVWPASGSLAPGTSVLIETDSSNRVRYECRVQSIDDLGVTCLGPHHKPVTYERAMVRTLSLRTQHLRNAYVGFVIAGAVLAGGGLACVLAGGGAGCAVVLAAGLGSGLVAGILHSVLDLRRTGEPTPIYIAPPEAATSASVLRTDEATPAWSDASSPAAAR